MSKTILITGATDGIGLQAAKRLVAEGNSVLLSGRNPSKLDNTIEALLAEFPGSKLSGFVADLSDLSQAEKLAQAILDKHQHIDVVINNAGIFNSNSPRTIDDLDVRFAVNTIAPYILTKKLLPAIPKDGRVVNISSAAQAPVDLQALEGKTPLADSPAYAQSKLAITMWSSQIGNELKETGPVIVSVNPGSLLASKMVKEAYGIPGSDIQIGADIIARAALSDEFADAHGRYYDNDAKRFANPQSDALNSAKCQTLIQSIEGVLNRLDIKG